MIRLRPHRSIIASVREAGILLLLWTLPVIAQDTLLLSPQRSHDALLHGAPIPGRPRVGIVLSGGGSRGLAQIGVLRALERHHIPIDLIVGNSLGSVVGALYASGYSTTEIESIAIHTNWNELLSFTEETKRTDLFLEQKQIEERGYLLIRFEGLEPIIPSSISGGQRLSNFFSYLTLQAPYHPSPSFDGLKIPFRAIATDLISGKRIILDKGSLAEAMRASVTVPLLYTPIEYDSMYLVDGGLTSNIPVDAARSLGCDFVIAVNSTSSMRDADQMNAPWEVADQIMAIMMQEGNRRELAQADVVITPDGGTRLVTDFSGIDSLIAAGERAGEGMIPALLERYKRTADSLAAVASHPFRSVAIDYGSDNVPARVRQMAEAERSRHVFSLQSAQRIIDSIAASDGSLDVKAMATIRDSALALNLSVRRLPVITAIHFRGNSLVPGDSIRARFAPVLHRPLSDDSLRAACEQVVALYRRGGYSLARIDSLAIDSAAGTIALSVDEGAIAKIKYEGNNLTRDYILRRELTFEEGDIFNISTAAQGIVNIRSTGLFDYVLLDIRYENDKPTVVIKVKEKSPELMRLALHADNEHSFVATVDFRDANVRGAWEDLGIIARYGYRDRSAQMGYTVNRIFNSYFKLNLKTYLGSRDISTYADDFSSGTSSWDRIEIGRYRRELRGLSLSFGSHFERFGDVTAQYNLEHHSITPLSGTGVQSEEYRFASLRLKSIIDTENKFLFPTDGVYFSIQYESASRNIGSEIGFGKFSLVYESYFTPSPGHTLRPRVTIGYADRTLPLFEQFSIGGFQSFYGLHEDDSYGRQLLLVNFEYRYKPSFRIIFDTYFKLRYDLASISLVPEELKLRSFRQALGAELALDTPLGAVEFGLGQSFYFRQDLTKTPLGFGPLLVYFSLGPAL